MNDSNAGTFSIDDIMVSAVHSGNHHGVQAKHLANLWHIYKHMANKTLDITSQRCVRKENPKLFCNLITNDRTLRYKHLKEHFYMDTLFATSKAGNSSRGNTFAQLFVTDKVLCILCP